MKKQIRMVFIPETEEPEQEAKDIFEIESKNIVERFEFLGITKKKIDIEQLEADVIKNINSRSNTIGIIRRTTTGSAPMNFRNVMQGYVDIFSRGINHKTDIYNITTDDELLDKTFFDKENLKKNWHLATFECII